MAKKNHRCSSCGRRILWARNVDTGNWMPTEPDDHPTGKVMVYTRRQPPQFYIETDQLGLFDAARDIANLRTVSHFAVCPNAKSHRR